MRLLADENIDSTVISELRGVGHHVLSVAEMEPSITDDVILAQANAESCILLTEDKDFGELAFRQKLVHCGVILIRLPGLPASQKAAILIHVIKDHHLELPGSFAVISPAQLRIRKP